MIVASEPTTQASQIQKLIDFRAAALFAFDEDDIASAIDQNADVVAVTIDADNDPTATIFAHAIDPARALFARDRNGIVFRDFILSVWPISAWQRKRFVRNGLWWTYAEPVWTKIQ